MRDDFIRYRPFQHNRQNYIKNLEKKDSSNFEKKGEDIVMQQSEPQDRFKVKLVN